MRLFRWLLGIAIVGVTSAITARSIDARKRRNLAAEFLQALEDGAAVVERGDPVIVFPGLRGDRFRGLADSNRFMFLALIDANSVHQRYVFIWIGRDGVPDSRSTKLDGLSPDLARIYKRLLDLHDRKGDHTLN